MSYDSERFNNNPSFTAVVITTPTKTRVVRRPASTGLSALYGLALEASAVSTWETIITVWLSGHKAATIRGQM